MGKDNVYNHFFMAIKDVEIAIESLANDIAVAYRKGDFEEASRLIELGKQLKAYCSEVQSLQEKWVHSFEESVRVRAKYNALSDPPAETRTSVTPKSHPTTSSSSYTRTEPIERDSKTNLRVELPSGRIIYNNTAAQTFAETIQAIGIERVKPLGITIYNIPLIATTPDEKYSQYRVGSYFIITHTSTKQKKEVLEKIADRLKIQLKVYIID